MFDSAQDKLENNFYILQEIQAIIASIPEKIKPLFQSGGSFVGGFFKK